jgi:hypothetical protein
MAKRTRPSASTVRSNVTEAGGHAIRWLDAFLERQEDR